MQFRAKGAKKKKSDKRKNPAGCLRFSFSSLLGLSARAEPDAAWAIGWSSWVDEKDDEEDASGRRSAVRSSSSRAITDMVSKPTDQTKKKTQLGCLRVVWEEAKLGDTTQSHTPPAERGVHRCTRSHGKQTRHQK